MRRTVLLLTIPLALSCGDTVDHPNAAPSCDGSAMDCSSGPPAGGGVDVGDGGDGGDGQATTSWTGQVVTFTADDFDAGFTFDGKAQVSATGQSGARVKGAYDGASFTLKDVLKDATNWFLVEPTSTSDGVLPTITPVDTRAVKSDKLAIGVVRMADVDEIFTLSLAATERSSSRAQIIAHVVDDQGRAVRGVEASLTAEVIAYRGTGTWDSTEGAASDDSGLIFMGNVPATTALSVANIVFRGSVSARVEARILAGATTVLTAVVSPP